MHAILALSSTGSRSQCEVSCDECDECDKCDKCDECECDAERDILVEPRAHFAQEQ